MRHWKQRWDSKARLVFVRRMHIPSMDRTFVPGDPVPAKLRKQMGERIKRWWDAGLVGLRDWVDPASLATAEVPEEARPEAPPSEVVGLDDESAEGSSES